MKVLVTGFDPFGGDKVNPAYEAVKKMPDEISGAEIIKVEVPTVFEKSSQVVKEAIQQHQPDVVICVGQAGGRSAVSFER
ncbi:pyroglutamyl-peptidase I family protein, partial [Faecalibacillus intestinalis]|nr:pyroglutamyl-peptidase I [Faecalibacillus intestinalis]HAR0492030.1 pyroglutamyl-peptidase I [Enterococcus faecium]